MDDVLTQLKLFERRQIAKSYSSSLFNFSNKTSVCDTPQAKNMLEDFRLVSIEMKAPKFDKVQAPRRWSYSKSKKSNEKDKYKNLSPSNQHMNTIKSQRKTTNATKLVSIIESAELLSERRQLKPKIEMVNSLSDNFVIGNFSSGRAVSTYKNQSISSSFYSELLQKHVTVLFSVDFKDKGSSKNLLCQSTATIPENDTLSFQSFCQLTPCQTFGRRREGINTNNESIYQSSKSANRRLFSVSKVERNTINFNIKKLMKQNFSDLKQPSFANNYCNAIQILYDKLLQTLSLDLNSYEEIPSVFSGAVIELLENQSMQKLLDTENPNGSKSSISICLIIGKEIWCLLMNKMKLFVSSPTTSKENSSKLNDFYVEPSLELNQSYKSNNYFKGEGLDRQLNFFHIKSQHDFDYVMIVNSSIMGSITDLNLSGIVTESLIPEIHEMKMTDENNLNISKVLANIFSTLEKRTINKDCIGCSAFFRKAHVTQTYIQPFTSFKFRISRQTIQEQTDIKLNKLLVAKYTLNYNDICQSLVKNLFEPQILLDKPKPNFFESISLTLNKMTCCVRFLKFFAKKSNQVQ